MLGRKQLFSDIYRQVSNIRGSSIGKMVVQLGFKGDNATCAINGVLECVLVWHYPVIEEVVQFLYSFWPTLWQGSPFVWACQVLDWLIINNNYEYFPKSIVKIFYFLYSPFIWDIKSIYQIIGLVDGMLYAILTIYLFRNWRTIWANPITRIFILIFIA